MYGCGCWAENQQHDHPGIACSTTGKMKADVAYDKRC
jgi:hypothetical protein